MKHRKSKTDLSMREEWKDEYRSLSNEIHRANVTEQPVAPEKTNRLRALGRYLRNQSGE